MRVTKLVPMLPPRRTAGYRFYAGLGCGLGSGLGSSLVVALALLVVHTSAAAAESAPPLRIVHTAEYAPFEWISADGQTQGYTIDLFRLWSRYSGHPVEFVHLEWEDALAAVLDGRVDVITCMTPSAERLEHYRFADFAIPEEIHVWWAGGREAPTSLDQLAGATLAVVAGDVAEDHLTDLDQLEQVETVSDYAQLVDLALAGRIDGIVGTSAVIGHLLDQRDALRAVSRTPLLLASQPMKPAVALNRPELVELLDRGFAAIPPTERARLVATYLRIEPPPEHRSRMEVLGPWLALAAGLLGMAAVVLALFRSQLRRQVHRAVRAMDAARQNELAASAQLQGVLNAATEVAVIATSPDGTIEVFNRGAERLLGMAADDVIGQATPLRFHRTDEVEAQRTALAERGIHADGFAVLVAGVTPERPLTGTWTYCSATGEEIPVLLSITAISDQAGHTTGYLGVAHDLSETQRLSRQLAESEVTYRQLFDAVTVAIFVHDCDTFELIDVNQTACDQYDLSRETILAGNIGDLSSGDTEYTQAQAEAYMQRAVNHGPQHFEWCDRRRDGSLFWTETTLLTATIGGHKRLLAVATDITDRKRIQRNLGDSERAYREVYDWISDALLVHDAETGRILDVNRAACRIFGASRDELLASNGFERYLAGASTSSLAAASDWITKAAAGVPQRFEWRLPPADGEAERWCEVALRLATINGRDRVLAAVRDITGRREMHDQLARSHGLLTTLVDSARVGVLIAEPQADTDTWQITVANGELGRLSHGAMGSLIGHELPLRSDTLQWRLADSHGRPLSDSALPLNRAIASGLDEPPREGVMIAEHGEQTPVIHSATVLRETSGLPQAVMVLIHDIGELKQTEAALRHRGAFQGLIADLSTRFIGADRATLPSTMAMAVRRIGEFLAVDQTVAYRCANDLTSMTAHAVWQADTAAMADDEQAVAIDPVAMHGWLNRLSSGRAVTVMSRNDLEVSDQRTRQRLERSGMQASLEVPMRQGEHLIGVLSVATQQARFWTDDEIELLTLAAQAFANSFITETISAALTARDEQLRQAQKMDAIGQLAGGVAHDFNNMLAGIMGFAELLQRRVTDDERSCHLASGIIETSERAASLTRQLLAFSRKGQFREEPVDLNDTIADTLEMIRRTLDRRIEITTALEATATKVIGDPALLQNAILNLAINAGDAMQNGGVLTIATANQHQLDPDVLPAPNGNDYHSNWLVIGVSDTGVGMTDAVTRQVFEPFFTTKSVGSGTGLGLSAVYGTMQEHGGHVSVDSTAGVGTSFQLWLPTTTRIGTDQIRRRRPTQPGDGTVLVIDDEEMIREVTASTLEQLGYQSLSAADGESGLAVWRAHRDEIRLVILDMMMPRMHGREVLEQMLSEAPATKIVVASGFARDADRDELLALGALGYLAKPYRVDDIADLLAQLLGSRQAGTSTFTH